MIESRPAAFSIPVCIAVSSAVLAWRALALAQGDMSFEPLLMRGLLTVLGITFLASGMFVYFRKPSNVTALYAAFCACFALHWGGPLGFSNADLRIMSLLFYFVVSGTLGETIFLHFAIVFTLRARKVSKGLLLLIYVPAVVTFVIAHLILAIPAESGLRDTMQSLFMNIHVVISYVFPVAALVLLLVQVFRGADSLIGKRYVVVMIAGLLTAWLPDIVVSALGGNSEPWTLTFFAFPIAFSVALMSPAELDGAHESSNLDLDAVAKLNT